MGNTKLKVLRERTQKMTVCGREACLPGIMADYQDLSAHDFGVYLYQVGRCHHPKMMPFPLAASL